jgi:predicted transcriptional regulator of viral defense system
LVGNTFSSTSGSTPTATAFWTGDAASVAAHFHVSEDQADEMLSDLADRGLIEKLVPGKFAILKWDERDESGEEAE